MNYIRILALSIFIICNAGTVFAANNDKIAISFHGIVTSPEPDDLPYHAEDSDETIFFSKTPFISNINNTKYIDSIEFTEKFINLKFTKVGDERMYNFTKSNLGKRMAVRINGNIVTALVIRSIIKHGGVTLPASLMTSK